MSSTGTSFDETENVPGIVRSLVLKQSSLLCRGVFLFDLSVISNWLLSLAAHDLE